MTSPSVINHRLRIVAVIAAVSVLLAYLAFFDPSVMPAVKCPFHTLTGFQCPGCGTQRAIHALFNGDIARAWAFNPALFFALPLIGLYALSPRRLRGIMYSPVTIWALACAVLVWWIGRNL